MLKERRFGDSSKPTLRRLLSIAKLQRTILAVAFAVGICATLATLSQPLAVRLLLDGIINGGQLLAPVALLVFLFVADAALSGLQSYLLGKGGESIVLTLRQKLVRHLLNLTVGSHDRHRTGDLLSRVSSDTTLLKTALTSSLANALSGVLTFFGAIVLMFLIDWVLLLVALSCMVVAVAFLTSVSSRVREASEETQTSVGRLSAALERALGAIRTVKVSSAEEREEKAASEEASAAYAAGVRTAKLESVVAPASIIAVQGSFVLVIVVGVARLADEVITVGGLVAFLLYLLYLVSPLATVFRSYADLQRGIAAVTRLDEILSLQTEHNLVAGLSERHPQQDKPFVIFDSVTFGYDPERPILKDVSFVLPQFSRTALVGPSGAGKTTVFALLERFYEVDAGTIFLEGQNTLNLPIHELRANIGYVEQASPMMAGTVRSNLLYANPNASEDEVQEIVDLVNLRSFVEQLPCGLDTQVGDRGILVSGGERQRIAVARTLLAQPKLLLLDEVTSQLDSQNELALRNIISETSKKCAVIVVAHRISTVADADQIIVLSDGRIRSIGDHEQLFDSDPLYRELVVGQSLTLDKRHLY